MSILDKKNQIPVRWQATGHRLIFFAIIKSSLPKQLTVDGSEDFLVIS